MGYGLRHLGMISPSLPMSYGTIPNSQILQKLGELPSNMTFKALVELQSAGQFFLPPTLVQTVVFNSPGPNLSNRSIQRRLSSSPPTKLIMILPTCQHSPTLLWLFSLYSPVQVNWLSIPVLTWSIATVRMYMHTLLHVWARAAHDVPTLIKGWG